MREYYKINEIAQMFGLTYQGVYMMCRRNIIPYTKLGHTIYINLKEFEQVLIDNKVERVKR